MKKKTDSKTEHHKLKGLHKEKRLKELGDTIEEIEEIMADADSMYYDLQEAKEEYKKLTGHEYNF